MLKKSYFKINKFKKLNMSNSLIDGIFYLDVNNLHKKMNIYKTL